MGDTDFTEQINNLKTEKGELEQQASDAKKKMVLHDQEKKKHVQELEQKKNEISALTEQAKKIPELERTVREQKVEKNGLNAQLATEEKAKVELEKQRQALEGKITAL